MGSGESFQAGGALLSKAGLKTTRTYANILESLDRQIFDTEPLRTNTVDFFQTCIGARSWDGEQKTHFETNLRSPGMLPAPERITLDRQPSVTLFSPMGLVPLGNAIWQKSMFSFFVNSKIYWQAPLWMFASPIAALHGKLEKLSARERTLLVDAIGKPLKDGQKVEINPCDPFMAEIELKKPKISIVAVVALRGDYGRAI